MSGKLTCECRLQCINKLRLSDLSCVISVHVCVYCSKVPPLEPIDRPQIIHFPAPTPSIPLLLPTSHCALPLMTHAWFQQGLCAIKSGEGGHLWANPTLSRYWRELLPSQMLTPFCLRLFALVSPLRNQNSSSATPALLGTLSSLCAFETCHSPQDAGAWIR